MEQYSKIWLQSTRCVRESHAGYSIFLPRTVTSNGCVLRGTREQHSNNCCRHTRGRTIIVKKPRSICRIAWRRKRRSNPPPSSNYMYGRHIHAYARAAWATPTPLSLCSTWLQAAADAADPSQPPRFQKKTQRRSQASGTGRPPLPGQQRAAPSTPGSSTQASRTCRAPKAA